MPTLTPTKALGATAKAEGVLYVEPDLAVTEDELAALLPMEGVDGAFLADTLSACLTHERCGVHLYRSVAGRTAEPTLREQYERFGDQTLRHVEVLEEVVAGAGGNPNYVSPMARAVEATNAKLLESTFLGTGTLDPITQELAMVSAVLMAEAVDHANWQTLSKVAAALPEGPVRASLEAAVAEVEPQEDEHRGWAEQARLQLTMAVAQGALQAG